MSKRLLSEFSPAALAETLIPGRDFNPAMISGDAYTHGIHLRCSGAGWHRKVRKKEPDAPYLESAWHKLPVSNPGTLLLKSKRFPDGGRALKGPGSLINSDLAVNEAAIMQMSGAQPAATSRTVLLAASGVSRGCI